jgi:phosphatidylglycerophosphate synthase
MRAPTHPRRVDAFRALVTFAGLIVLQLALLRTMRRRIGPEPPNPADLLTGSRVVCAAGILTAAVTGPGVQTQKQQRRLFVLAVLAATVTDWCDGPLARRFGPTRLGAVMDIEADSLLTLALAAAAVQWGGLSRLVLIPPVVRYSDLVRTVRHGMIFTGDAIWWCRASGGAQMLCFLLALAPGRQPSSRSRLRRVAIAVSLAQLATQARDGRRRFGSRSASEPRQPKVAGAGGSRCLPRDGCAVWHYGPLLPAYRAGEPVLSSIPGLGVVRP